ncbi:hypothetical protein [Streptomyces sp. JV178]|nr:hypothetical protein [Streptomyces sp. JV178]
MLSAGFTRRRLHRIAFAAQVHSEDRRTRLEPGRRSPKVMLRGLHG